MTGVWDGLTPPSTTIVADPPWPIRWDGRAGGLRHFDSRMGDSTMTVDEIPTSTVPDPTTRRTS